MSPRSSSTFCKISLQKSTWFGRGSVVAVWRVDLSLHRLLWMHSCTSKSVWNVEFCLWSAPTVLQSSFGLIWHRATMPRTPLLGTMSTTSTSFQKSSIHPTAHKFAQLKFFGRSWSANWRKKVDQQKKSVKCCKNGTKSHQQSARIRLKNSWGRFQKRSPNS